MLRHFPICRLGIPRSGIVGALSSCFCLSHSCPRSSPAGPTSLRPLPEMRLGLPADRSMILACRGIPNGWLAFDLGVLRFRNTCVGLATSG